MKIEDSTSKSHSFCSIEVMGFVIDTLLFLKIFWKAALSDEFTMMDFVVLLCGLQICWNKDMKVGIDASFEG